MVLAVEVACYPASTRIEDDNRTRLSPRLMLWRLIDADRDVVGDLLVVYGTRNQFLVANDRLGHLLHTGLDTFRRWRE
jgi:hypothetical protein